MAAVGACHRFFMASSMNSSHSHKLKRLAIHQYNRAIASILPTTSIQSTTNTQCILICCLLFISCEGLTGRYDEVLQHLKAGDAILGSSQATCILDPSGMTEKLIEMFCCLGAESSGFMQGPGLPGITYWCHKIVESNPDNCIPFESLDEAAYELRLLDFRYDFEPSYMDRNMDSDFAFKRAFGGWCRRFEALGRLQNAYISTEGNSHFQALRLRQKYWEMAIETSCSEFLVKECQAFIPYMEAAQRVAEPLIALNQPTFSLDGGLVSGLAFAAAAAQTGEIKSQALDLLRRLNHREGIFDSNDIVEMHDLAMSIEGPGDESGSESEDESEDIELDQSLRAPAGIPRIIEGLCRRSGKTSQRLATAYSYGIQGPQCIDSDI
jgi:hypothetical protein